MRPVVVAALAVTSCGGTDVARAPPPPPAPAPEVRLFGSMRDVMHEGKTAPKVRVRDVVPGPHAYGVGALSELRGEITVVDDAIWLAYPKRVEATRTTEERAALLAVARVPAWSTTAIDEDVAPNALEGAIEKVVHKHAFGDEKPVPVYIEGTLSTVAWHVVTGSASHDNVQRHATRDARGTLVGFFSKRHEGTLTHTGEHTHLHVILPDMPASGHVDKVGLRAGALVHVPAR